VYCASNALGCSSLAANGRRNRLTAICQLPRHQGSVSGGLSELSGRGWPWRSHAFSSLSVSFWLSLPTAVSAQTAISLFPLLLPLSVLYRAIVLRRSALRRSTVPLRRIRLGVRACAKPPTANPVTGSGLFLKALAGRTRHEIPSCFSRSVRFDGTVDIALASVCSVERHSSDR
jgi:hypothetical protein